jgi:hypothetical protein
MPDLSERLAVSLRGAYVIERELTAGGMSRVFVAEEMALGRKWRPRFSRRSLSKG